MEECRLVAKLMCDVMDKLGDAATEKHVAEQVVALCPGVLECAAVGVPDEAQGEAIKIFVVRSDPALTEDEVARHCHDQLTGYKRPRYIEFRDELPKTNVGKILRRELRAHA